VLFELMLSRLEAERSFAVPLDTPTERIAPLRAAFEASPRIRASRPSSSWKDGDLDAGLRQGYVRRPAVL